MLSGSARDGLIHLGFKNDEGEEVLRKFHIERETTASAQKQKVASGSDSGVAVLMW